MVQDVEIARLNAATYNPRVELRPGSPEWEKLEKSIREFGNVEPIVWNERTGNVVGGHQRLAVLKMLGETAVPCSIVNMSETDEKLLNVALNKIKGSWDYDKLEKLLQEFDMEDATLSGFSEEELATLLADSSDIDFPDGELGIEELEDNTSQEGLTWSVALHFPNADSAIAWLDAAGIKHNITKAKLSTVIIM